jgi:hypothetical protein
LKIPFASEKHALIAKQTIEVDPELQPHAVKRTIEVEGNILVAYVERGAGLFIFDELKITEFFAELSPP